MLGVVTDSQHVRMLSEPIPLNDEFVQKVTAEGDPEKRFRFAGKCIKGACRQWTGNDCGVMKELSDANADVSVDASASIPCVIRPGCRWFHQDGFRACLLCPFVITQGEEELTH